MENDKEGTWNKLLKPHMKGASTLTKATPSHLSDCLSWGIFLISKMKKIIKIFL
jgi:hypothetical protein